MATLAKKVPDSLRPGHTFCPGCGHGVFLRVLHDVFAEKGLCDKNICCVGVGCSATYHMMVCNGGNAIEGHHGRGPVMARAMKALLPDVFLWTYQGDGDAYAIGMGETMLAAHFDYPVTVFTINNCNYGMTGGQYAPTTQVGQITTTTPSGSKARPFDIMTHMKAMDQVAYAARGTVTSVAEIRKLQNYIRKAVDAQMTLGKYAMVEVLSPCPTNWHKAPVEAHKWVLGELTKVYPLGEFKTY